MEDIERYDFWHREMDEYLKVIAKEAEEEKNADAENENGDD
jgi:hypothetical protein